MKISIFASIGAQNLGDELILKNEIKILEEEYSQKLNVHKNNIQFIVFTYDIGDVFFEQKNIIYKEYFPIAIKKPKNILRNIKNFYHFILSVHKSDLIVFGGGGIIYDNEMQSVGSPLKQWLFRMYIFKLFRKKVEFFRGGIHIKNKKNLSIIKKIFSKVDTISVRDNYSYELLQGLHIKNKVSITKDSVFFDNCLQYNRQNNQKKDLIHRDNKKINNIKNNSIKILNYKLKTLNYKQKSNCLQSENLNLDSINTIIDMENISGKTVGISLRQLHVDNYFENILEILFFIIDSGGNVIFIPHSFHKTDILANDYIFMKKFYDILHEKYSEKLQQKKVQISICTNMKESYQVYTQQKIDFNFAQRLHSIILSHVYNIEFIGISYSKKTDEILEQLREGTINPGGLVTNI